MDSLALPFPVMPGKEAVLKELFDELNKRQDEFAAAQAAQGNTMSRFYSMATPAGTIVTSYVEGKDVESSFQRFAASDQAIDKYALEKVVEITGMDMSQGAPPPVGEMVIDYVDDKVPRGKGLAFSGPVAPGMTDELMSFTKEVMQRRSEHEQSRRPIKFHMERVYLLRGTPMGDIVSVYLEGEDPVAGNRQFAASGTEYDMWFKEKAGAILGIDFNEPIPPIETLMEWEAG